MTDLHKIRQEDAERVSLAYQLSAILTFLYLNFLTADALRIILYSCKASCSDIITDFIHNNIAHCNYNV